MRKLAYISTAFAGAIFAAHYVIPSGWLLVFAAIFAAAALISLLTKRPRSKITALMLLFAALGLVCCRVQYLRTIVPAEALAGREITVEARVTDFPTEYDDCTALDVKLCGADTPHVAARIYDYGGCLPQAKPGDILRLPVKFTSASHRYGEKSDAMFSRNIFAVGYAKGPGENIGVGSGAWLYFPQYAARAVKNAVSAAFPADAAAFEKALLMGDKTEFYDSAQYVNMRTSGLIHVVAVSGLHVAFLVGFLQLIMGRNRRSSLICLVLVWLFVIMTGGAPSTVRSGFMQSMLLIAPLFGRENDGATSLTFALAVILLISPAEAGSAALQLSFGAMGGIMLISPAIYSRMTAGGKNGRLKNYAAGVVSNSLGAVVFTAPLLALRFGYVPILGPLVNLLCLWAVTVCFCGGFIACAAWALWPVVGKALGWATAFLVRYIALVCGLTAKLPFAAAYTANNLVGWWLVLTYLVFMICWLGRGGKKFRWIIPGALSAISLCAVMMISALGYAAGGGSVTALNVGQGACTVISAGKNTVVVDCGGTGTGENAGDTAAQYLMSRGRTGVDALILTHLHADHAGGAVRLMRMMKVKTLIMPVSPNDDDGLLAGILGEAQDTGTEVKFIGADSLLTAGKISVSLFAPPDKGTANERGLSMKVSLGAFDTLITGDMNRTAEKEILESHDLTGTELIIAGHHGSKYSSSAELLAAAGARTVIISVGYNSYGHPSNSALRRIWEAGAGVYRTDLNGNITVKAG